MRVTDGTSGNSPGLSSFQRGSITLTTKRWLCVKARQVIDDFHVRLEAGLGGFLRVRLEVIDAADAVEHVELQTRSSSQEPAELKQVRRIDDDERIDGLEVLGLDPGAELLFEEGDDFRRRS